MLFIVTIQPWSLAMMYGFNAVIASLLCREGKKGIKPKARAIKYCKEIKITAPPNEWRSVTFNYTWPAGLYLFGFPISALRPCLI